MPPADPVFGMVVGGPSFSVTANVPGKKTGADRGRISSHEVRVAALLHWCVLHPTVWGALIPLFQGCIAVASVLEKWIGLGPSMHILSLYSNSAKFTGEVTTGDRTTF